MRLEDRITITPGVRGGKPCIKGTRITVYDILEGMFGIRGPARAAPVKLAGDVKLLFDENLSPRLVTRLDRVFPGPSPASS